MEDTAFNKMFDYKSRDRNEMDTCDLLHISQDGRNEQGDEDERSGSGGGGRTVPHNMRKAAGNANIAIVSPASFKVVK